MRFNRFLLAVVFVASQLVIPRTANAASEIITVQIRFGTLCISTEQREKSNAVLAICSTNDNRQLFQIEKSATYTALRNGNFCLSTPELKNGTDLQNIGCSTGNSPMWIRNGSRLIVQNNRNVDFCFDIENGAVRTGAVAQIWECVVLTSGSFPAQTFSMFQITPRITVPPITNPPRITVPPITNPPRPTVPPTRSLIFSYDSKNLDACVPNTYGKKDLPKIDTLQEFCRLVIDTWGKDRMLELLSAELVRTGQMISLWWGVEKCNNLNSVELTQAKGLYMYRRVLDYKNDKTIRQLAVFSDVVSTFDYGKKFVKAGKKIEDKLLRKEYENKTGLLQILKDSKFLGQPAPFDAAINLGRVVKTFVKDVEEIRLEFLLWLDACTSP